MIVILDTNVLSLLATPVEKCSSEDRKAEVEQCTRWYEHLLARGAVVVTSDICDYEVRRELILIKSEGAKTLDKLREIIIFQPLSLVLLNKAAELWAEARAISQPNKDRENIDVDIIVTAQWSLLQNKYPGRRVVIATKNIKDFLGIADCALWQDIIY